MCVIIYKPAGVAMPAKDILARAAAINPDGAGLMTARGVIHAAPEDMSSFIDLLGCVPTDEAAAIHFRWATHGQAQLSNCHPFSYGRLVLMHNGIIGNQTASEARACARRNMTDSEVFLQRHYAELKDINGAAFDATARAGGRFAILDRADGRIHLFGQFTRFDGCYFSNTRPLFAAC